MERGGFPSFFIGGKMLTNLLCFIAGMTTMYILSCIISVGHSVNVLNQTQQSCAALFVQSEQGLQEILQLKYLAMEEAQRSEQNIIAQKYIDQLNLSSVKTSIMRNYVEVFPSGYIDIMKYSTWEELEIYVDEFMKAQKERK